MSVNDDAEVTFGDLDFREGAGSPFLALSEGATPGSPAPFITSIRRQLFDGEIVTKDGDGNRIIQFSLLVTGNDPLELSEYEALLTAEVYKRRNTLRLKPQGMNSPVSVFDTFVGEMRLDMSHDLYDPETRWVYEVTLPALPHARSESESTATLELGRRLVDDGSDASNWTAAGTDEVTSVGGRLRLRATEQSYDGVSLYSVSAQIQFNEPIALDRGRYVSVVVDDPVGYLSYNVKAAATGYPLASSGAGVALGGGRTRHFFGPFPAGFIPDLVVQVNADKSGTDITLPADFWVDDLYVEATLPAGSSRFVFGQATVEGSVRSPQSLTIENAALGNVQVFVCQPHNGFRPDLSPYFTGNVGGSWVADADLISGGYYDGGVQTYDVPAVTLRAVNYDVIGHVSGGTPGSGYDHTVSSQLFAADGSTELTALYTQTKRTTAKGAGWAFVTLGSLYPPAVVNPNSTNIVRIEVDAGLALDEVWLVPKDATRLQVEAGDATRLRVVSPSVDYEIGAVFIGTSDADERQVLSGGQPKLPFDAGVNMIHVVTTGAVLDPDDVTVTGFPAWHSNAAK